MVPSAARGEAPLMFTVRAYPTAWGHGEISDSQVATPGTVVIVMVAAHPHARERSQVQYLCCYET